MTSRLAFDFTAPSKLSAKTPDHAATAVISLAHSAVTYWSCFAIHKNLRHLKNMKLLLRHGIYTSIYCVKIFSWLNIPKRRSEKSVKISVQGPFKEKSEMLTAICFVFKRKAEY